MAGAVIALRSLLFNIAFLTWSGLIQFVCLPVLLTTRSLVLRVARTWVRVTLAMLAGICGLRYEIRGLDNLPKGPCIVASKHQSAWDTLIFLILLERPSYIYKRELSWIPMFGWYLARAGGITVERVGGAKALVRMVKMARRRVAKGSSILIFPEGTRVSPGRHLPHQPGVAALYDRLAIPVVPVAVNSGLYWGRRSFRKKPGCIVLEFLAPIPPGQARKRFSAELEIRIEAGTESLLNEAARGENG